MSTILSGGASVVGEKGEVPGPIVRKSFKVFEQNMDQTPLADNLDVGKELLPPPPSSKAKALKVIHNPFLWSALTLILSVAILYMTHPDFTQKKVDDPFEEPGVSHIKVWGISGVLSLIVLTVPLIVPLISKKK
jgi:magnesium-transporting ATPase (P-type)